MTAGPAWHGVLRSARVYLNAAMDGSLEKNGKEERRLPYCGSRRCSLEAEINAHAADGRLETGVMGPDVCRERNRRSEGHEIGARGGHAAKIGVKNFALD